jgi:PncC family amidohydrolase
MDRIEDIADFLVRNEVKLATAESCTAGLIVSELARIPGSGQAIDCGLAVYSPQAKNRYLGVDYDLIDEYGLTSEAVADAMVVGAINNNDANAAVANTGIAGPAAGPGGLEPGTVCLAWAIRRGDDVHRFTETRCFEGERNEVRRSAAHYALQRLVFYYDEVFSGHNPNAA